MKNILLFSLFVLTFTGCITVSHISTTSGLESEYLLNIPQGSRFITVVQNSTSPEDLYEDVYTVLLMRGHRIAKDDKERGYITTEGKDVGQSTIQRMQIVFFDHPHGSAAKITTEWKPGTDATNNASAAFGQAYQTEWEMAIWGINRPGVAFGESIAIANSINEKYILFE